MNRDLEGLKLLNSVLEIYDQKYVAEYLNQFLGNDNWNRETINRWVHDKAPLTKLTPIESNHLKKLLPQVPKSEKHDFTFIDLFAGIGGIRKGFEASGGKCLFTSEWDKYAQKTYKRNHYSDPDNHTFNEDIREITQNIKDEGSDRKAYNRIKKNIPEHDVLLAGFPCQPFSIAGVSKKNSLGRKHGFECTTQGTLFFDVARIIKTKKPTAFLLENVKNLKSHDKGNTFKVITETLEELGYWVADVEVTGSNDPKVIDAQHYVPQHRERIILVGFRKNLDIHHGFTLRKVKRPDSVPVFKDILEPPRKVDDKYILTKNLWEYLYNYAIKHKAKGNGFGYGLMKKKHTVTRTLSARYYKDGSEILIDRGWSDKKGFKDEKNLEKRPRRLMPRECARLMGFDKIGESEFIIPVSDTQAYKQFGNSVAVPVFEAVAKHMKKHILMAKLKDKKGRSKPKAA